MFVLTQLIILIAVACGIALYFLPTAVAWSRRHPQRVAIFMLNLFGGWTVAGWVVAIVWAFTVAATPASRDQP